MTTPKYGTEAYRWWHQGATDEAHLLREGMTDDGRQVWDYVTVLAQQGRSALDIADATARVFTAGNRRARWRLAWKLVRK